MRIKTMKEMENPQHFLYTQLNIKAINSTNSIFKKTLTQVLETFLTLK